MRDDALRAILAERWRAITSGGKRSGEAGDPIARTNRAVALYEEGRWAQAAKAFEEILRREGPASEVAPAALFSLGYCRLELEDDRRALEATTLFLDLSNEEHPFYWDGVHNVACAASRMGYSSLAVHLYRVVLGAAPHPFAFNGLALALAELGRADEGLCVLDAARRAGHRNAILDTSEAELTALAAGRRRPTILAAPPWSRRRILRAAFHLLGWDREPLPPSALTWRRDV